MNNQTAYIFQPIGMEQLEQIKSLFVSVFTAEPWNDDWSDQKQLTCYLTDLTGQSNSLSYGLFEGDTLIGMALGHIKHWFTGTEYSIEEFCIRTDRQGGGIGTRFLHQIEEAVRLLGVEHIFLQTSEDVPAYHFYQKNGFEPLRRHVSLTKKL